MTEVYIAPEVAEVRALHPYLVDVSFRRASIRDQIDWQAHSLREAHQAGDTRVRMQVMSWWPEAQGKTVDEIMQSAFTDGVARLTVCREYGFASWGAVEALGDMTLEDEFETALDLLLSGDEKALSAHLAHAPELAQMPSRYGHRATLLHYLAANGVESHRQVTPMNAVVLAQTLIAHGADRAATATMYGGGQTPHMLATTSAHPHKAGIAEALARVLL